MCSYAVKLPLNLMTTAVNKSAARERETVQRKAAVLIEILALW